MESHTDHERKWYDRLYGAGAEFAATEVRDGILSSSTNAYREAAKPALAGKRVLEIGCGTGTELLWSAQSGAAQVEGIDISSVGITKANQTISAASLGDRVTAKVMNVEALEYPAESFDVVLDREVLSSIEKTACIKEIARVLVPGGCFIGIECLGHNPIFNWHRKSKEKRGERLPWAVANILKRSDLALMEQTFGLLEVRHYHLLLVLATPFLLRMPHSISRVMQRLLNWIDGALLSIPLVQPLAFKVVFVATKNHTTERSVK